MYNVVRVERAAKCQSGPRVFDEAARYFFRQSGLRPFGFSVSVRQNVPRNRGLGSSSTVRLGILHGLNRLAGKPLNHKAIFQLCARLEGHPDNAAPASFGGFTVVRAETVQRFDVSPRLKVVLLIPEHEVRTSKARRILPKKIGRTNAVQSCGNACAITAAFVSRNYESLHGAFADEFHQPFRAKLIPYLGRVIKAADQAGALGAFLSGSGSTIAALTLGRAKSISQAMLKAIGDMPAQTVTLPADNHGVVVTQHKA